MSFEKICISPEEKERYLLMNYLICILLQHPVRCTYIGIVENQVVHSCTVAQIKT